MKSIRYDFNKFGSRYVALSTYMSFAAAIHGRGYNKDVVRRWFNKLVDKDDYCPEEKCELLEFLYSLAKRPEGYHIRGTKRSQSV